MMSKLTGVFLMVNLALCFQLSAQSDKPALKISHLVGDFYVYTTYQVYENVRFPSNSMYLVTEVGVVMFDTPWNTSQCEPLLDSIATRHKKEVVLSISTHYHEDRTAGLRFLASKGVQTYASKRTLDLCRQFGREESKFYFENDTTFNLGGYLFQTSYSGAGHTKDNIVIWFPQANILYGGCLIKSTEATTLGNIADADLKEWPGTLLRLKKKFPNPAFIVPGHQAWQSKRSIDHTLELLRAANTKQ